MGNILAAPTSSQIVATSTTAIRISFALVSGSPGYTATAVNGGSSYSISGSASPLVITGIPAADTPLQYSVSVKCSGTGVSSSSTSSTPILTYMISNGMVGNLVVSSSGSITYTSNGVTNVNGSNTTSIQSGTAYIDRANGLTIGSVSTLNTFMDLPNLTKTYFQNKNTTFYMKFSFVNAPNNSRAFVFCNTFPGSVANFSNLAVSNTTFNYAYYEASSAFDLGGGSFSTGTIYHLFFVFSTGNTQKMTMYKNNETTAQFTGNGTNSSSTVFSNYLRFTIAREYFSTTKSCSLTLYYANLLPVALTTTEMQNISTGSLTV